MKHTSLLIVPLFLASWGCMAQMTYEEAVNSNADYYAAAEAANHAPDKSGLGPDELQNGVTGELTTDVLYKNTSGLAISAAGTQVSLEEKISDYKQVQLVFTLMQEGIGAYTTTRTIPTNLWYTDSSHSKKGEFYRYGAASGADKDRWSAAMFWRTGDKRIWFAKTYDRYSDVRLLAVVGIK